MDPRRALPSVDRIVEQAHRPPARAARRLPRATRSTRRPGRRSRPAATSTRKPSSVTPARRVERLQGARLRPVVNATGVLLHTNLGRAPIGADALADAARVGGSYSNLEFDLATGGRGSRDAHAGALLARACGAEAGLVVNNNAAAVLLTLAALARGRDVVVSRGELVEIGGGFRVPEIMAESGCRLVEVGTTNRTRLADYERALGRRRRAGAQGARVELPDDRVHRDHPGGGSRRARAAGDGRRRLGPARRDDAVAAAPAGVAARRARRPPGHRRRRRHRHLLGRQAARRTPGRHRRRDAATWLPTVARHPLARAIARRQDHPRRAPDRRRRPTSPATRPRSRSGAWPRCRSTTLRDRARDRRRRGRQRQGGRHRGGRRRRLAARARRSRRSASRSTPATPTDTVARGCAEHGVVARVADGVVVCDLRTVDPATTPRWSPRCVRQRAAPTSEGRRHRRSRRPRQVVAGPRAHRHRSRPVRGGEGARAHHRPGLRVHRRCPRAPKVGFVDVPGHERFVKNMLAGVGAVDVALFVVAANEGWMPQSEEHLRILDLLGVRHGIVALTKADTVGADALDDARRSRRSSTWRRSSLRDAPVVVCDSVSGRGLDDVRRALDAVLAATPPRPRTSVGPGSGSTGCSRHAAPARWSRGR